MSIKISGGGGVTSGTKEIRMDEKPMEVHPAANAFPMMDDSRYSELRDDIRENGIREPITLCDGLILDGRNRYKACCELGIEPQTKSFVGDPWSYVWSLNGERRDLAAEQRYLIWKHCSEKSEAFQAELKKIEAEANRKRSESAKGNDNARRDRSAEKTVVQHSVAQPLKRNRHKGDKSKAAASYTNKGAVVRGDKLAKERPDLAEQVRSGKMKPAEAHRKMKKDSVSKKAAALPNGKYGVLYADPPWKYNDSQGGTISESYGAAEKHYPCMTLSELKAMDIPSIAADDCVLFLWATCPLLEDALALGRAWGFKYKAQFVWDKIKHNMGHYNSVRHELLLICTKGSATPENVKLYDSVQTIERTRHSEKPNEFREIIETLYPSWKKIELFARVRAKGWESYGNEC